MNHTEHTKRLRTLAGVAAGLAVALVSGALMGCAGDGGATATPTRTPAGAAAAAATATPAPPTTTPTPQVPPTPVPTITPTSHPDHINPLTGEAVSDPSVLDRVPVAIKIDNYPPDQVWPHTGINSADLIFEHYNEGWFSSRWTAVFLGKDPEKVGTIRSGRIIDLEIPAMYKGVFACSGFSAGVTELFKDSDLYPDQLAVEGWGAYPFVRDENRDMPFNLYSSPAMVREWAAARGVSGRQDLRGMVFSEEPTAEGTPATYLQVPWYDLNAEWRYDAASGRYLRWSDGAPHMDALDDRQLSSANVVVLYVPQWDTDIVEDHNWDALSIRWALWDSNRAVILRDGVRINAFWQRWERTDLLTFTDEEGNPMPLKVGNTFFEVVPTTEDHWIDIVIQ